VGVVGVVLVLQEVLERQPLAVRAVRDQQDHLLQMGTEKAVMLPLGLAIILLVVGVAAPMQAELEVQAELEGAALALAVQLTTMDRQEQQILAGPVVVLVIQVAQAQLVEPVAPVS
jgi:hypothetical protein